MSRKLLLALILIILSLTGLIFSAPYYLLYSSPYKKADAIVVLLGPDFKARQKEANDLIREVCRSCRRIFREAKSCC